MVNVFVRMTGVEEMSDYKVTVKAPINIALIKYWGKSDEEQVIPCNDSISMTIDSPKLLSITTVQADPDLNEDQFVLNGQVEVIMNKRIRSTILKAREFAGNLIKISNWKLRIESRNTVPTASGLASSASGIAALAYALIKLYKLEEFYSMRSLSSIARLGSGSACRSLFAGLVHWHGEEAEGVGWWKGLNGFVLAICGDRKKISSTTGMQRTVQTSSLFHHRIKTVIPERIESMLWAIKNLNFPVFAELAMKDSNSFHACCLDTLPPISYLNFESMRIIAAVHEFNEQMGRTAVGYTFDAGPNAVIFGIDGDAGNFIKQLDNFGDFDIIPWKLGKGPEVLTDDFM